MSTAAIGSPSTQPANRATSRPAPRAAPAEGPSPRFSAGGQLDTQLTSSDEVPSAARIEWKPLAENVTKLGPVDGLGDIRRGARIYTPLALSGIRLRRACNEWDMSAGGKLAHGSHGLVAIHPRHHDVHQHEVDVGRLLE